MAIGLLHPGEMGAAIGAVLRGRGETVLWASAGRAAPTATRAEEADLEDVGTLEELVRLSDVIATARAIGGLVGRYVDGGIVGPPPREPGTTRLYLSGTEAPRSPTCSPARSSMRASSPRSPARRRR